MSKKLCANYVYPIYRKGIQRWNEESKIRFQLERPTMIEWVLKDKKGASHLREFGKFQNAKTIPIGQTKSYLTLSFQTCYICIIYHLSVRSTQEQDNFSIKYDIALLSLRKAKAMWCNNRRQVQFLWRRWNHFAPLYDCPNNKRPWEEIRKWLEKNTRKEIMTEKTSQAIKKTD